MEEKKYRRKGFLARSLALYNAARLGTRMTAAGGDGDSAIRPIESISAIRRSTAIEPRNLDDTDINALS